MCSVLLYYALLVCQHYLSSIGLYVRNSFVMLVVVGVMSLFFFFFFAFVVKISEYPFLLLEMCCEC